MVDSTVATPGTPPAGGEAGSCSLFHRSAIARGVSVAFSIRSTSSHASPPGAVQRVPRWAPFSLSSLSSTAIVQSAGAATDSPVRYSSYPFQPSGGPSPVNRSTRMTTGARTTTAAAPAP
ncbi:hypothetical protein ADL06_18670 [Streptomyces sp. NRRL F-6491]|nr:hypothetical protein ADL06_18670 [Streptomyces sp. NRRL F-6491]KOX41441.1 hypothetical protein ADL08_18915 [Streptomyces sp. NRRL F-6492]